jgi:hypothetical protein
VSIILTDGRLPGPSSFWWASTSPLLLVVGIRLPKKRPDSTPSWHHQRIPWAHASCGGVSAATGTCHVTTHVTRCPKNISLPALPRRDLSSFLSTRIGGELSRLHERPNGLLMCCVCHPPHGIAGAYYHSSSQVSRWPPSMFYHTRNGSLSATAKRVNDSILDPIHYSELIPSGIL